MSVRRPAQGVLSLLATDTTETLVAADLDEIVAVALALGADRFGGELSSRERRLITRARSIPETPERVREAILAGQDPFGEAICVLRSKPERQRLGAFYTPLPIVRDMVGWALGSNPGRLVDPGCGSGRFAAETIRRNRQIEVLAVDLDPIATLSCRAVLATLGAECARVINGDYTSLSLPELQGKTAFVGNPPYVRHHRLSTAQKARAKRTAAELGMKLSGLAGLHIHFFLATFRHSQPGDIGCFITSSEWLDVSYGEALRASLLDGMGGMSLHLLAPQAAAFKDAMTTAVISCFEIGRGPRSIRMRTANSTSALGTLDKGGRLVSVPRLRESSRWTPLFQRNRGFQRTDGARLGDIVRVSRGAVTGGNRFFIMSYEEAEMLGLEDYVRPVLTSARQVLSSPGVVRANGSRLVLLDPPRTLDLTAPHHSSLRSYLDAGRSRVANGYICRHRRPWWHVGSKSPPMVATYMARQPPAFALNPDGLAIVNVLHGLFPKVSLSDEQMGGLVGYLNAHRLELRGSGRTYQGGLEKFEPSEMEAIKVPPVSELTRYSAR